MSEMIRLSGRGARADEVYFYLRDAIADGTLPPGERLVEGAVARTAGVSRTPVREALHRLEVDGLVRMSNRGLVVADFSSDELADLCRVRVELEGLACRLAAAARTDDDLAVLDDILNGTTTAVAAADVVRLVALNHAFHRAVAKAARNIYFENQLDQLRSLIERLQTTTLTEPERQSETLAAHRKIVQAISARDEDGAAAAGRAHFASAAAIRLRNKRVAETLTR